MVDYQLIAQINKMSDVDLERLPSMKRWPYGDESKYRAVYVDKGKEFSTYAVPIGLNALVPIVKEILRSLPGCSGLKVYRSTLIDNDQWKKLTGRVALPIQRSRK
jgi:hypothetical protein